ncbi:phosphate/phosphite/phosphonate ABC transporter substrate-binding protein [Natrinema salsiterrestre]|uniref:Phosphate/phosphite/phosphonate ABC transporter substrate-binding protein n=1 Tax=Natrinema salsiterrestre TaxID=2950540 RepID=A0A9Q4Q0L2_9EURY|nr:phosphate/phosphite/phosphonate ABC transporter substrate-binding protein [Natrinema salsiterrestre]MDF9746099.1 phosphate/phosphite/phosphonate ABC transporter substrate-binding protein [Natrinema salsiterrestre]
MNRRTYLGVLTSGVAVGAAGCLGDLDGDDIDSDEHPIGAWADGTIEFGLPPFQDAEELERQYAGTFEWLADGFEEVDSVEGTPTTSYSAVVESVVQGHTELANLSPVIYVIARDEGIHPLAINWSHGSEAYHSYIATRAETDVETLEDLEGATVAMVDPLSSSGGLFPRYMLAEAGLDAGDINTEPADFDVEWSFGHDAALQALENGHVDAAAYGDFQHPGGDEIVKVAESEPIPFDPIVVKPDTPETVRDQLSERLIKTPDDALEDHRVDRYGPVEPGTYDPVRDVAEEMGVEIADLEEDADEGEENESQ